MLALHPAWAIAILLAAGTPDTAAITPKLQRFTLEVDPAGTTWNGQYAAPLEVRRPTRELAVRFTGAPPSRVEMWNARGRLPLVFGMRGDSLHVELADSLRPGEAAFTLSWTGRVLAKGPGLVRTRSGSLHLVRAARVAVPEWAGPGLTPWKVAVQVPAGIDVRTPLPLAGVVRNGTWRMWSFTSRGPLPADSLRFELVPRRTAKPANASGAAPSGPPRR